MTGMTTEFRTVPLTELHESPHNPRKHFHQAALDELAESLRTVGVLTPLLVRPNANGYEIAAGHRRYRAAQLAQLDSVPCLVRPLTDQQFMEILTIENLQREDVHPLDEAKGYEALMAAPYKMPVEKLAERVGRSVKYVYDRVKLLTLTPSAQQLFWDGLIEAGHAILLARLTPTEQATVIGTARSNYEDGGLFQAEHRLFESEEEEERACQHGDPIKARSVRELDAYIKRHVRFNAARADAFLFPDTVAQVAAATQAKRKIVEITHEYLAGDDVRAAGDARVYGERAWRRADGQDDSKTCDRSVLGVIASGPGQGQAFAVCINKDKCLVHWGAEIKAREKNRALMEKVKSGAASPKDKAALERRRAKEERERRKYAVQDAVRNRWRAVEAKLVAAVIERVKTLPTKPDGYLAGLIVDEILRDGRRKVPGLARGKSFDELIRYLGAAVLVAAATSWGSSESFPKIATYLGLDLRAILLHGLNPATTPNDVYEALEKLCGKKPAAGSAKTKPKGRSAA